jgi:hypothetical protein
MGPTEASKQPQQPQNGTCSTAFAQRKLQLGTSGGAAAAAAYASGGSSKPAMHLPLSSLAWAAQPARQCTWSHWLTS